MEHDTADSGYTGMERGRERGRALQSQRTEIIDLEETVKRITSEEGMTPPRHPNESNIPIPVSKSRIPIPVKKGAMQTGPELAKHQGPPPFKGPPKFKQPNLDEIAIRGFATASLFMFRANFLDSNTNKHDHRVAIQFSKNAFITYFFTI